MTTQTNKKIAALEAKREQINALISKQMAREKEADRKARAHRYIVLGAAVTKWAANDGDFSQQLRQGLGHYIEKESDRQLLELG